MPEGLSRSEFSRVDQAGDPESFVDYLDAVSQAAADYKQLSFQVQDVHPGDSLLDLGCGPGDDARLLARLVGSSGQVIGIDNSEAMIAEARRRAEECELPIEFRIGNAHQLDFPDNAFDGARAERVLQHLHDPRRALQELARVTRPGGRIVIGPDPDWETLVIDCSDGGLMRRIRSSLCDSLASGSIAHETPGLMHELALEDVSVKPVTLILTEYGPAELLLELTRVSEQARDTDAISEDERANWCEELRLRDEAGRFFLSLTGFLTSARST